MNIISDRMKVCSQTSRACPEEGQGRIYVDKELINTNISWFEFNETDKTVTIKNEAIDIDELIAMPFMITDEDLDRYYNSTFYDPDEKEKINKPDNITMIEL